MDNSSDIIEAYKKEIDELGSLVFSTAGKYCTRSRVYKDEIIIADHIGVDTVIPINNPRRGIYGAVFLHYIKGEKEAAGMNKMLAYNKVRFNYAIPAKEYKRGEYLDIDDNTGMMFLTKRPVAFFYPRQLILAEKYNKLKGDEYSFGFDNMKQDIGNYPTSVATGGREKDEIPDYRYIYKKRYNEEWA
jgi:hypothetical protein